MSRAQIMWAKEHDWFSRELGNGEIEVVEWWNDGTQETRKFNNYEELRKWAGY